MFLDRAISEHALRDMRKVLNEAGIDPRSIVCEVTEKKPASEEALFDFVSVLKANGFRIAVDDFGSDESDIKRIRDIKPDIVKFDAHWITRLMESGAGFALLKEMVSNFEDKGIRTVFEGLEESWQLELAERSGASMVQGFVLALPQIVPASFTQFEPALPEAVVRQRTNAAASPAARLAGRRRAEIEPLFRQEDAIMSDEFFGFGALPADLAGRIVADEVGLEFGVHGDFRLRCAIQPVFRHEAGRLTPVAVDAEVVPYLRGRPGGDGRVPGGSSGGRSRHRRADVRSAAAGQRP